MLPNGGKGTPRYADGQGLAQGSFVAEDERTVGRLIISLLLLLSVLILIIVSLLCCGVWDTRSGILGLCSMGFTGITAGGK